MISLCFSFHFPFLRGVGAGCSFWTILRRNERGFSWQAGRKKSRSGCMEQKWIGAEKKTIRARERRRTVRDRWRAGGSILWSLCCSPCTKKEKEKNKVRMGVELCRERQNENTDQGQIIFLFIAVLQGVSRDKKCRHGGLAVREKWLENEFDSDEQWSKNAENAKFERDGYEVGKCLHDVFSFRFW